MATPNSEEILEKARELFFIDNGHSSITPEDYELKESGYYTQARNVLMTGEDTQLLAQAEEFANGLNLVLVSKKDKEKLEDLEDKKKELTKKEQKIMSVLEVQEMEKKNGEKLQEEIKQVQNMQSQIMAKLEEIPDLAKKIDALSESPAFKDLGQALKPMSAAKAAKEKKQQEAENIKMELIDGQGFVNVNDPIYQFKHQSTPIVKAEAAQPQQKQMPPPNLEGVVDLQSKIEAMKQSPVFKDLGEALSGIPQKTPAPMPKQKKKSSTRETFGAAFAFLLGGLAPNQDPETETLVCNSKRDLTCKHCGNPIQPTDLKCGYCGAKIEPEKPYTVTRNIPKHKMGFLDFFAGAVTFIIWLAATAWIWQSIHFSWGLLIGLAVFWLAFVVVFRLMIGGILD
jgi:hypothetical protein